MQFRRIGIVARWQPPHLGHAPVLRALCEGAGQSLIGIGSSNRVDYRNPFTLDERTAMIRLVLADRHNYTLIPVPDVDDGPRWRAQVVQLFGALDMFVTDNPYVASLLAADYAIIKPVELVPASERIPIDGGMVRREMARGDGWPELVPEAIADYIITRRLDERFRRQFGLQTLALDAIIGRALCIHGMKTPAPGTAKEPTATVPVVPPGARRRPNGPKRAVRARTSTEVLPTKR